MQQNENGEVAVCYYQTIPKVVRVNGNEYAFAVRANICMAWVVEEDVNAILALTKTCCGGTTKRVYRLASEADVRRWTNGGGR